MKRVKNFKVKLVGCMAIVAMLVVGVFTPNIIKRVNAATPGYFNDYDHDMVNKFSLEQNDGYDCLQGMSIYGDLAFYAKFKYVKNEANENHKVGIWAYNLKSGKKYKVYKGKNINISRRNILLLYNKSIRNIFGQQKWRLKIGGNEWGEGDRGWGDGFSA